MSTRSQKSALAVVVAASAVSGLAVGGRVGVSPTTARGYALHTAETAPEGSRATLRGVLAGFGFVPNILAVFAESPALLNGYAAIDGSVGQSTLTPVERTAVYITAAAELESGYCVPGHCTVGQGQGMSDQTLEELRSDRTVADPRLEVLRTFTRDVIRTKGAVSDEQLNAFFEAGFTRANSLDVLAIVGQKTISTYAFNLTRVPVDEAFKAQVKTKPAE